MIVRELITRLGFTTDSREANKYDALLKKLRDSADKAAKKAAADTATIIGKLARAEAAVARTRGAQAKAIQEAQQREARLETIRERNRQRQEKHDQSLQRMARTAHNSDIARAQSLAAARKRFDDAQLRRDAAMSAFHAATQARALRAIQVRTNAQRRADQVLQAGQARAHNAQIRSTQVQAAADARMRHAQHSAQQRYALGQSRQAAFDARQAAMRRREIIQEQQAQQRLNNLRRQAHSGNGGGRFGELAATAASAGGIGYLVGDAAQRVDEMSRYSTRLNSQFDKTTSTSRDAELQRIAMLAGVDATTVGEVAYKTMRSASSIGIKGMTQGRALDVTEAVGLGSALSGSSSEATNAALIQLFQGIESNRLGGEELRSVMEQTPELARAIMKQGGYKDMGAFRAASKNGDITGKVVVESLEKALPELRARAGEIPITFNRTFAQLSTRLNYFLLDAQNAANITGKFNEAITGLADSLEKKLRSLVASMGGWEVATEKLVAIIAGTAIPIIVRLGMTILSYLGPVALLAGPLILIFSSMMEFARMYPKQWENALGRLKSAFEYFIESVLYAFGQRLKPFGQTSRNAVAKIPLEDKGNGIVGYKGKEYRADDAALMNAVSADYPQYADQIKKGGARLRVAYGKDAKNNSEIQKLPGGETSGSSWEAIMLGTANVLKDMGTWFQGDGKTYLMQTATEMRRAANAIWALAQKLGVTEGADGVGSAAKPSALQQIGSGTMQILSGDVVNGYKTYGSGVMDGLTNWMKPSDPTPMVIPTPDGGYSRRGAQIDKVEVNVQVQQAAGEQFIKNVGDMTKSAIQNATGGRSSNGTVGVMPMENTSRPTE